MSNNKRNEKHTKLTWGRTAAEFYWDLKDKQVVVSPTTGGLLIGKLIGCDTYDIVIQPGDGPDVMVSKGNIVYISLDVPEANGDET